MPDRFASYGAVRRQIKRCAYGVATRLGLPRRFGRYRGKGLIILTYHSIGPHNAHPYLNRLPPERFAFQLRHLKAHYDVVPLGNGLARLEAQGKLPDQPLVAITIDDGYVDSYEHAFPIARHAGVPLTIFLATDYLDSGGLPWPTRLDALLHFATAKRCPLPNGPALPIDTATQRAIAGRVLRQHLSVLDYNARAAFLNALEQALAPSRMHTLAPLSWSQVIEMQQAGMTFGAHTQFHGWLDRLSAAEIDTELRGAKSRIEQETGIRCDTLAYPNGNHSADVRSAARKLGYRFGLTQQRGINRASPADPLALLRVDVPFDEGLDIFACRVAGLTP